MEFILNQTSAFLLFAGIALYNIQHCKYRYVNNIIKRQNKSLKVDIEEFHRLITVEKNNICTLKKMFDDLCVSKASLVKNAKLEIDKINVKIVEKDELITELLTNIKQKDDDLVKLHHIIDELTDKNKMLLSANTSYSRNNGMLFELVDSLERKNSKLIAINKDLKEQNDLFSSIDCISEILC